MEPLSCNGLQCSIPSGIEDLEEESSFLSVNGCSIVGPLQKDESGE
jgi:hypothetical protein